MRLISVLLAVTAALGPSHAQERPNILFLFSDDQRADAFGAAGNPTIATPHTDRLAEQGFRFTNAYCMGSHHGAVCAPSRTMLMTGRSLFHVYDRIGDFKILPQFLQEAGYATYVTGKWHFGRTETLRGFTRARNVMFAGMSDHFRVPVRDLEADGTWTKPVRKSFSSTVFADTAIEFIAEHAQLSPERPFFAYVAFSAPHDPRSPPGEWMKRYEAARMPLPPDYMPVHPFHNGWMTGRDEQLAPWPRTKELIRQTIADYYGMISHMDAQIGRILTALREHGFADNTIVIFSSDHGLSVGSHGLLGKQNLYEHSMKAPLIVAGPGIPKGRSDAFTYLFDLFPTILRFAGAAPPTETEGRDLAPIWRGQQERVRDLMFTTYEKSQRALRSGDWKLIRYPLIHHTQLFDLSDDPHELVDLAASPEQKDRVQSMMAQLARCQRDFDDPHPLTAEQRHSMKFDPSQVTRTPDRHQPPYVIERFFKGTAKER